MATKTRHCEICVRPIEPARIEALPQTRLCADHARKVLAHGGEFIVTATQERTSKVGSLKQSYGSVSTSQTRNHEAIEKLREAYHQEQDQQKS